ncbi:MAG: hypothetical protein ABWZ57_15905 [Mesorhizobium sp.]
MVIAPDSATAAFNALHDILDERTCEAASAWPVNIAMTLTAARYLIAVSFDLARFFSK